MKNQTLDDLRTLENKVIRAINETMYSVLDNGDRPDKRIEAIIGLNDTLKSVERTFDKMSNRITEAP